MIAARKTRWFTAFFARHARSRIEGTFGRVLVHGAEGLREACAAGPVLVVANHTSWWDPLVAIWLTNEVITVDSFAMMDAANLRRLPFFGRVGAFGVDLERPSDGARAIRYAARLLDRPLRLVWIYPEGRERSPHAPLDLRPGAAAVGRLARGARLVAVGVRYVFAGGERPDLWVSIATAEPTTRDGLDRQRAGILGELARIDAALLDGDASAFTLVAETRPGILARLAERALAWLFAEPPPPEP